MMKMILKRQIAAKKNKKKGFTLIEVIVVIVIIAILAAIAVPSLTRYITSAGYRADMAMAHNVQVVLQAELTDKFGSPGGIEFVSVDTGLQDTIKQVTVENILAANGIILVDHTLTGIAVTPANAKLDGFVLTSARSIVTYNGTTLTQTNLDGSAI